MWNHPVKLQCTVALAIFWKTISIVSTVCDMLCRVDITGQQGSWRELSAQSCLNM